MFWPPHFSCLRHILNMPCLLACNSIVPAPSHCLNSPASYLMLRIRGEQQQQHLPPVRGRGSATVPCCSLPIAVQTDTDAASCSPLIHQCTPRTRCVMSTDISSTLWPSYKFQHLQPSSIFMPWAGRLLFHEVIHRGAAKDRESFHSQSTLIHTHSSYKCLQMDRVVRCQSNCSTQIILETYSTKQNFNLNALKSATSRHAIIIYISRYSHSKSLRVLTANWKCGFLKPDCLG